MTIGLYFGIFQTIMPMLGYLLGTKLIKDEDNTNCNDCVDVKTMLILAIATSIDAFVIGITFAFLKVISCYSNWSNYLYYVFSRCKIR